MYRPEHKAPMVQNNYRGQGGRGRGRSGRTTQGKECYTCGKFGHISKECWHNKKNEECKNLVTKQEEEILLLTAKKGVTLDDDSTWYMDTGASNHMSGHHHLFQV